MRQPARLVTPADGTIIDPFAGSGTTVEAGLLEGFKFIGIEREPAFIPLIGVRLDRTGGAPRMNSSTLHPSTNRTTLDQLETTRDWRKQQ